MRPYSLDLRQRVVAALDAGEGSQPEIAARFRVSVSFITRLLKRRRRTGSVAPRPTAAAIPRPWTGRPSDASADWSASNPTPPWRSWPPGWASPAAAWRSSAPCAS